MSFDRGAPAFWFVEITLDDATLRLSNAFDQITFDGQTYQPFGDRMTPPPDIDRSADLRSQKFSIGFDSSRQTDNADPIGIILDSNWRRRPVRVRYAVGAAGSAGWDFSDPFIIIDEAGRIKDIEDEIQAGETPNLEIEIESGALIFLERRNQTRSPANQRAAFPGDAFFDYALKLDGVVLPWRTKKARNGKVQITYDVEGSATREMLFGRGLTRGSFVFGATGGEQRKYWAQVYALADCRCEALEEIYINGSPVLEGVTLEHGVRTALGAFASGGTRLWVTWYDGRHDQTADSYLISLTAGQALPWTSAHRGRGVSYCIIEHLWDSDNAESFTYEFQLQGARVYQERFDTTAGGSGSQRLADPDTWAFTTNAADIVRHFLRGIVVSPSSSLKWFGVGAESDFIDPYSTYAAQAAHCAEAVPLKEGGEQPRYESNGWITASADHKTNLQRLADSMVASAVDDGSRISIRLSEPQSPVIELLDTDLAEDAPTVIGANARADDVVNRIEGRFQDPENKFQAVDYPAVSDAAFEEIDGAELTDTWNQVLEISEERAQRKALLYLNNLRRTVELEETFGPKAKGIRPGNWLTRKSALRGFPDGKTFIADEVRRFADGTVRLILLEVNPGEPVWLEENAELTPPPATPPITSPSIGLPSVTITAVSVSSGGAIYPAVTITRPEGDDLALEIDIEIALDNGSGLPAGIIRSYSLTAGGASAETIANLLPGTDYVIRFRYSDGQARGAWTDWQAFTTTGEFQALTAGAASPDSALADALDTAGAARDTLAELILSLQVRLDETRENLADLGRINGVTIGTLIDQIRREIATLDAALASQLDLLAARVDDAEAAIIAEQIARASALAAEAAERALLAVRIQNNTASILAERSARVTADEALALDVRELEASLDDVQTGRAGDAQAIAALTARVRINEEELEAVSGSVTHVSASVTSLSGNLTGQALSIASLTSRVRTTELGIQSVSSSVTALSAEVGGLNTNYSALADALNLIEVAINEAGGSIDVSLSSITSLASQVAALGGTVSGNTSAVNALTTRTTAAEGTIAAQAASLLALNSTVGGLSSSLAVQASTLATLEGRVSASYGIRGRAGTSEFEIFALAPGGSAPSEIILSADQIRFRGAVIIEGTLETAQLAPDAVIGKKRYTGSNVTLASNATYTNILSDTVPSSGGKIDLEYQLDLQCPITVGLRVQVLVAGSVVRTFNHYAAGPFTHTVQAATDFECSDGAALLIRAMVQRSEGVGQSGCTVASVRARSFEFKR